MNSEAAAEYEDAPQKEKKVNSEEAVVSEISFKKREATEVSEATEKFLSGATEVSETNAGSTVPSLKVWLARGGRERGGGRGGTLGEEYEKQK